ncbi:hypothetical protein AJ78_04471 [Emergomyces pasteurianus Ep9510]|uniref:Uncharacterized protein n=1 Tax=Emergomyces pasteurianus Ep9510 TaxID=1447872 RepID=A0A1J9PFM8_9EURO|nr:hypothetical protein AJ78_04471 [Emergomyces pasteurianus Ep9510]
MSCVFEVGKIRTSIIVCHCDVTDFFQHLDSRLPITAIRVLDIANSRLILSGCGPYLHLIDEASGRLLDQIQLFETNNIHGIQLSNLTPRKSALHVANFLAWGGPSFRLFSLEVDRSGNGSLSFSSPESAAPDWILDANIYHSRNDDRNSSTANKACLITAHNALFGLELEDDFVTYQSDLRLHQIGAGLKSVLYSADLSWLSSTQILVAAGTVFGEIVVWSCFLPTGPGSISSGDSSVSIHHLFAGHEGSIFGVDISPEIHWLNDKQSRRFLASCSDDRTIRIWDISDCVSPVASETYKGVAVRPATRSTGFGNISRDDLDMDPEACIAKAWGHTSRIWSACFVDMTISDQPGCLKLVSRGEDATCQVWELRLQSCSPAEEHPLSYTNSTLQNVSTHTYHTGKNIWSMAVHKSSNSTTIYSGGADGSIHTFMINTSESPSRHRTRIEKYDIYDLSLRRTGSIASTFSPVRRHKSDDRLNRYAFISKTSIIGISSHGKLSIACFSDLKNVERQQIDQEDASPISWHHIATLDSSGSQFSIASQPDLGIAMIGDAKGTIWWYRNDTRDVFTFTQLEKKITSILFASSQTNCDHNMKPTSSVAAVTISLGIQGTNIFLIPDKNSPENFTKIPLDPPSYFLTTSAVLIEHKSWLILGAKTGHLSVFDLNCANDSQPVVAELTVPNLHSRDTITFITPLLQPHHPEERILTTGRDGHYCIHSLIRAEGPKSPLTLQTIHKIAPPFGPYIEGAYFDKISNDLILFGFKGTEFIIWNESTQTERATIECGGAHRTWAYSSYHADVESEAFAWTKASTFNLFRKTTLLHRPVTFGNHGREIKVAAISDVPFEEGGNKHRIIATGGEDTMIHISLLDETNSTKSYGSLHCLRSLKKHNAGIQHLQWSPCGTLLFSSAGAEEFYVWRLRSIPGFGMGAICEGECPKMAADSDLRITSFDLLKICTLEEREDSFLLCLAYSNSTVKVFQYVSTASGGSFNLLAKGKYTTNCLTQIKFSRAGPELSLITASTDGHITTWSISESLKGIFSIADDSLKQLTRNKTLTEPWMISWQHQHCIHQSSIRSIEIVSLFEEECLIVAGGDDNAISISRLRIGGGSFDQARNSFSTLSLPQAHASTVSAVSVLERGARLASTDRESHSVPRFLIASSGNDQRLKLWSAELDSTRSGEDGISVSLLQDVYTAVADISSMDSFRRQIDDGDRDQQSALKDRLVLCGVGVDLWSVEKVTW